MILTLNNQIEINSLEDLLACNFRRTIKDDAGSIERLFKLANFDNHDYLHYSSRVKTRIQKEAELAWINNGYWGSEFMATGSGKSKIGINIINRGFAAKGEELRILIAVPTIKLRDKGWKAEFNKWNSDTIYNSCVTTICYDSLNTLKGTVWDLVILDEGHNLTEDAADFFSKEWGNVIHKCLLLTATKPQDSLKKFILKKLNLLKPVYELDIDTAIKLNIVADYTIDVIMMDMDESERVLYNKFNTGRAKYNMFNLMNRMHFIYQLSSKERIAKKILERLIPQDLRTLIFCGSKDQANHVNADATYYSKPTKPTKLDPTKKHTPKKIEKYNTALEEYSENMKYYLGTSALTKFELQDIKRLACVMGLNEGHNIDIIDCAFIVQLNSKELHLIQRIGRILRIRANFKGRIIILNVRDSVDEQWCQKALANIDPKKVKYINLSDLITEKIKLF